MKYDLAVLKQIIISAAREELLPRFADVQRSIKIDGSFVTEADLATQARILRELQQHYPDTTILGEEMTAEQQRVLLTKSDSLWCLDPLDGTSNFAVGTPYYAISLAMIERGVATLGIVYDPNRDECFVGIRGQGAFLNDMPLKVKPVDLPMSRCTALIDFNLLAMLAHPSILMTTSAPMSTPYTLEVLVSLPRSTLSLGMNNSLCC